MPRIVQALCENLLLGAYVGGARMANVDEGVLASPMAEADEPALRCQVLRLAVAVAFARADRHLADGAAMVMAAARRFGIIGDEAAAGDLVTFDP